MNRLLFVTLSNIGDLVMTTPALVAMHDAYPDARIDIVADLRSSELLSRCPFLGDLVHRVKQDGKTGMLKLVRTLRARRYEAIVDLRTDFLPWLLRAHRRSARWQARDYGPHAVEQHFAVAARVLPSPRPIPATRIWLSAADREQACVRLASLPGTRRLIVAPGANWPGKRWPLEHYTALANLLREDFDSLILLGNAADAADGERMLSRLHLPTLNLMGRTSLIEATAVLEQGLLFVGNDSGLGHLAAAAGVRGVTLFGPGRPARYRPWGTNATVVMAPGLVLDQLQPATVAAHVQGRLREDAA